MVCLLFYWNPQLSVCFILGSEPSGHAHTTKRKAHETIFMPPFHEADRFYFTFFPCKQSNSHGSGGGFHDPLRGFDPKFKNYLLGGLSGVMDGKGVVQREAPLMETSLQAAWNLLGLIFAGMVSSHPLGFSSQMPLSTGPCYPPLSHCILLPLPPW